MKPIVVTPFWRRPRQALRRAQAAQRTAQEEWDKLFSEYHSQSYMWNKHGLVVKSLDELMEDQEMKGWVPKDFDD